MTRASDASPNPPRRKRGANSAWQRNPNILQRMRQVERLRLERLSNLAIAARLHVDEATIRTDLERLQELWAAELGAELARLRGEHVAAVDHLLRTCVDLLRRDEQYTQAVLFNTPVRVLCPGRQEHRTDNLLAKDFPGDPAWQWGTVFSCTVPHKITKRIYHDDKGAAQYRRIGGQVLQVIQKALMDRARVVGLVAEKRTDDGDGMSLPDALAKLLLDEHFDAERFAQEQVHSEPLPGLSAGGDLDDADWEEGVIQ